MSVTIFHNPRCSKSRATLTLLRERGIEPVVIEYLKTPPDLATITALLTQIDQAPIALVRTGDKAFEDAGMSADETDVARIASVLAAHPALLQRPIVVRGDQARIGRPPSNVLALL